MHFLVAPSFLYSSIKLSHVTPTAKSYPWLFPMDWAFLPHRVIPFQFQFVASRQTGRWEWHIAGPGAQRTRGVVAFSMILFLNNSRILNYLLSRAVKKKQQQKKTPALDFLGNSRSLDCFSSLPALLSFSWALVLCGPRLKGENTGAALLWSWADVRRMWRIWRSGGHSTGIRTIEELIGAGWSSNPLNSGDSLILVFSSPTLCF